MAGAIQNAMGRYKILCGGRAVRAFTRRQYCALPGDCPLAHQNCTELPLHTKVLEVGVGDISFHHQETSDDIDEIQDPRYHMSSRTFR